MRVTQNMLNNTVMSNLNRNADALLKLQSQLSSGKRLNSPSDDPVGAANAIRLRARLSETEQLMRNIDQGETQLTQSDAVFGDMTSILTRAQDLAISQANTTADANTREAVAQEIGALIDQFVDMLNTKVGNRYIFAGYQTLSEPFHQSESGISYSGDSGDFRIEIESGTTTSANTTGSLLLPTAVDDLGSHAQLNPYAERAIPLDQRSLNEANLGTGVDDGYLRITSRNGRIATVDLTGIGTVGEAVLRLNAAADENGQRIGIKAELNESGRRIVITDLNSPQEQVTGQLLMVEELGDGRVGRQLGITGEDRDSDGVIGGRDLAMIDLTTRLEDLNRGSGIELGSFRITDRLGNTAAVDISGAETLENVRELINAAGTRLEARINTGGNGLMIVDTSPAGATGMIRISEEGRNTNTARDLGLLTPEAGATGRILIGEPLSPRLTKQTAVCLLNRGQGFELGKLVVENGPKKGQIDLSGAATVGDILSAINGSGLDLKATINDSGNGIAVTSTVGGRTLRIGDDGRSFTASLLGFAGQRDVLADPVQPLGEDAALLPTIAGQTRLKNLNAGLGVSPGVIRITDALGHAANVTIDGVNTVQGVVNQINRFGAQGSGQVNIVASLSADRRSLTITDLSIQNTSLQRITATGNLSAGFADLQVGAAVSLDATVDSDGSLLARNLDLVSAARSDETTLVGEVESVDRDTRLLSVRTADGTLYRVASLQTVDNVFIGQSLHLNGTTSPTGEFEARTVEIINAPAGGGPLRYGTIEAIDRESGAITLLGADGVRTSVRVITGRGLVKVEDVAGGHAARDLGIDGVSVVGADRVQGRALDPLIDENTALNQLGGGTFTAGKLRISNGDRDVVVDLSNARTVGELLTAINNSGAEVLATINSTGRGIALRSKVAGTTLMVNKIALKNPDGSNQVHSDGSTIFDSTADSLGLTGSSDVLGNLLFLRQAMLSNNREDIAGTLDYFSEAQNRILSQRTKTGALSNQLTTTADRGQGNTLRNTEILTGIEDLDVVEAVSELSALENAFNAALNSASRVIMPSLLDYL